MKKQYLISLFLAVVCIACGNRNSDGRSEAEAEAAEALEEGKNDMERVKELVAEWNEALNQRDYNRSQKLYASTVFFYTRDCSSQECAKLRTDLAIKDPVFSQRIISDIEIVPVGVNRLEVYFTKETSSRKGPGTYRSYLVFENDGNDWKIVKESDETTDANVARKKEKNRANVKVPADAIRGDFDGDGTIDRVWIDARYDEEYGVSLTDLTLKSDNPALNGLKWRQGLMGVHLVNLGDLDNSNKDFLGAIPYGHSTWCHFETYVFKNGLWRTPIPSFSVWMNGDNDKRVYKSDKPGYVMIIGNNLDGGSEDPYTDDYREVKLSY